MWILAALSQVRDAEDWALKIALAMLNDANRHEALRTVAAIYVGRFGDHARRKSLIAKYPTVSQYIQAAIYFSSRQWPVAERNTAKATWGGHSPTSYRGEPTSFSAPLKKQSVAAAGAYRGKS